MRPSLFPFLARYRGIMIALPFIFLIAGFIMILSWRSLQTSENTENKLKHTYEVEENFYRILLDLEDAESSVRSYFLVRDSTLLTAYKNFSIVWPEKLDSLKQLIHDNPAQVKVVDSLYYYFKQRIDNLHYFATINPASLQQPDRMPLRLQGQRFNEKIKYWVAIGQANEARLLVERKADRESALFESRTSILIFMLVFVVIIFSALLTLLAELNKRSRLEKSLKSILDASTNGIFSFRAIRNEQGGITDFRFMQANRTAYMLTRQAPGSVLGKKLQEVFPTIDRQGILAEFNRVVDSGVPLSRDYNYLQQGKERWLHLEAVKLEDGFTLTFEDITAAKLNEMEVQKFIAALEQSNAELGGFAYVVSHDLQEPLRKILSFIDRLVSKEKEHLSDDSQNYLHRINQSALRMRALIEDLLLYSRVGKEDSHLTKINLNILVSQIISDMDDIMHKKNVQFICSELPVVEAHEIQMQQLFQNLIGNSLKFTQPGRQPVISIRSAYLRSAQGEEIAREEITPKSWCLIEIRDNGIGFENKYADKIFQVFQRLHLRNEYEGTGIGLALCDKIVSSLHGTIKASGVPGEGALFTIVLPLRQTEPKGTEIAL